MRNLICTLVGRAKVSGRANHDKSKPFIPKKVDKDAILSALIISVQKKSLCPICNKVIDLRLGVTRLGDDGYIPNDPLAPSCDRILNGDSGYTQGNVRITHRGCNTLRNDRHDLNFTWENPNWSPTEKEVKKIQNRNAEIKQANFLIEITNTTMNTKNDNARVNKLAAGLHAVAHLNFTIDEFAAAMKMEPNDLRVVGTAANFSSSTLKILDCLKNTGFTGKRAFTAGDLVLEKTGEMYLKGVSVKYLSKVLAEAYKQGALKRVGVIGKAHQYNLT